MTQFDVDAAAAADASPAPGDVPTSGATGSVEPTVCAVMPAYNAAAFIDQALASIAAQSRLPDQVIIIDDASTDDTAARARSWSDRLPIEVVSLPENRGSGYGRRLALGRVTTDLVALVDADDAWTPDHLEHLLALWEHRGGVVSARAWVWHPGSSHADYHESLALHVPRRNQFEGLLYENFVFAGSLFSLADYERVGGFPDAPGWEDWELWVRMAAAGVPITAAKLPTVLYRRHDSNQTVDSERFDRGVLHRVRELRKEHPEWLDDARWERVIAYRVATLRINRGASRLRRRELRGAGEVLAGLVIGRRNPVRLARRVGSRLVGRGRRPQR